MRSPAPAHPHPLPLLLASLVAIAALISPPVQAMQSPWWEDYDIRERFRCSDRRLLVVERNDAQAALLSDRQRFTLFREPSPLAGLHYRTEGLTLILKGDELTLDQPASRITCLRTEEV